MFNNTLTSEDAVKIYFGHGTYRVEIWKNSIQGVSSYQQWP